MSTPLEQYRKLAEAIGVPDLYFKREDLHPYGSHKGRSIPVMIEHYLKSGDSRFAISSSGNAALAAALYVRKSNDRRKAADGKEKLIDLDILIGQHAAPHKAARLKELTDDHIRVTVKERPLQALSEAIKEGARSLRQSTDDTALIGYESLAAELVEIKSACAVFLGTSSGTTAQALAYYFTKNKSPIQVHIVQTSSCHPLSDSFESYDGSDEPSTADAIVDKTAHRKDVLIPLIEKTGGRGWVATNDDIKAAQELTLKHAGLDISANSALSVAGVMKATSIGWKFHGAVVCLICGE